MSGIAAGFKRNAVVKGDFWEVFGMKDCAEVPETVRETALLGKEFTISNLVVRDSASLDPTAASAAPGRLFNMGFRCALATCTDSSQQLSFCLCNIS